ncbi:MAG: CoxG family protein [Vulcanimicrobiaceae bacterium]
MTIEDSFHVDAPLHRTWPVLNDIPRVATCIPNAEITEIVDDHTYRAQVSVKVGPVSVSYRATIIVETIDEEAHSATFHIHGDEVKGRGGVRATVITRAVADGHRTQISLHTVAQISGVIATVGGRLIEGVAKKTVAQFAQSLSAMV